jgi:DNA polymerase-4
LKSAERKIIHVDMDCFFAAVEVKHNDLLLKKPIAVGGRADKRGVIAAASYEARAFGVKSAMSTAMALKLCPQLIIVHPQFSLYKEESVAIKEIFSRYTEIIEPLSLDEAFLDVTTSTLHGGSATLIAREIRHTILLERGLTASAGIANNKFLAKVASDLKKPNGQFTIAPKYNFEFTEKLPVEKIFGVGQKTKERMHSLNIFTCNDLRKLSLLELQKNFGKFGDRLNNLCRGVDHRTVKTNSVRKSFSVERTFDVDLSSEAEVVQGFLKVFDEFTKRFEASKHSSTEVKGVSFKLKTHDFVSKTKDNVSKKIIPKKDEALNKLISFWKETQEPVRLIGFGVRLINPDKEGRQLEFEV